MVKGLFRHEMAESLDFEGLAKGASMRGQGAGLAFLVVHGEALDHAGAGAIQPDDVDSLAMAPGLEHDPVERADG